jgi:hypothetical protein
MIAIRCSASTFNDLVGLSMLASVAYCVSMLALLCVLYCARTHQCSFSECLKSYVVGGDTDWLAGSTRLSIAQYSSSSKAARHRLVR